MAYAQAYSATTPTDATAASGIDDEIKNQVKIMFAERLVDIFGLASFGADPLVPTKVELGRTASPKIIGGSTDLLFRNNADSATNLKITDAGVITLRDGANFSGRLSTSVAHNQYNSNQVAARTYELAANTLSANGMGFKVATYFEVGAAANGFVTHEFAGTALTGNPGEPYTSLAAGAYRCKAVTEAIRESSSVLQVSTTFIFDSSTDSVSFGTCKRLTGQDFTIANDITLDVIVGSLSTIDIRSFIVDLIRV